VADAGSGLEMPPRPSGCRAKELVTWEGRSRFLTSETAFSTGTSLVGWPDFEPAASSSHERLDTGHWSTLRPSRRCGEPGAGYPAHGLAPGSCWRYYRPGRSSFTARALAFGLARLIAETDPYLVSQRARPGARPQGRAPAVTRNIAEFSLEPASRRYPRATAAGQAMGRPAAIALVLTRRACAGPGG
jgi:hypothetical protein